MNKTLQYILIFVICFAAAMLVGRLFKSESDEYKSTLQENDVTDSLNEDIIAFNKYRKKSIKRQKSFLRPEYIDSGQFGIYRGENDLIFYEYYSAMELPESELNYDSPLTRKKDNQLILDIIASTSGIDAFAPILLDTKVYSDTIRVIYESEIIAGHLNPSDIPSSFTDWKMKVIIKNCEKYDGVYFQDSLIWTNK